MRCLLDDLNRNICLTNWLLWPLNQQILTTTTPKTVFGWIFHMWPLWYNALWVLFLGYLIAVERAGLEIIAQQIWCFIALLQVVVKFANKELQEDNINQLIRWCEKIYSNQEKEIYSRIVANVFEKGNLYISLAIR